MTNEQLNKLAQDASSGDGQALNNLVEELHPKLKDKARSNGQRWQIPNADLESEYLQAVWEATIGFDSSQGNYSKRLNWVLSQKEGMLIRYYRAKQRNFPQVSMNRELDDEGNTYEQLLPSPYNLEADVTNNQEEKDIKKLLASYSTTHEQYGEVIQLLANGSTNIEIAATLGATSYDATTRKKVERAKKHFRNYLSQH